MTPPDPWRLVASYLGGCALVVAATAVAVATQTSWSYGLFVLTAVAFLVLIRLPVRPMWRDLRRRRADEEAGRSD